MQIKFYFILSIFVACTINRITDCPKLSCEVIEDDEFDNELDSQYGDGDDDLFTAGEPSFYIFKSNEIENINGLVNDYNLQSAYFGRCKNTYDTIYVVFNFKGLKGNQDKPVIKIDEIDFFNGNRKSLEAWKKSKNIKELEVIFRDKCIGKVTLQNTYKMQVVKFNNNNLSIYGNKSDTLSLIIRSIYEPEINNHMEYAISEIKFCGTKYY